MLSKSLVLVFLGSALVMALPPSVRDESFSKIRVSRDVKEVDESNHSEYEHSSIGTPAPAPEQELPEDQTESPSEESNPSIRDRLGQWWDDVGNRVKETVEEDKKAIKETWESFKSHWNKYYP